MPLRRIDKRNHDKTRTDEALARRELRRSGGVLCTFYSEETVHGWGLKKLRRRDGGGGGAEVEASVVASKASGSVKEEAAAAEVVVVDSDEDGGGEEPEAPYGMKTTREGDTTIWWWFGDSGVDSEWSCWGGIWWQRQDVVVAD